MMKLHALAIASIILSAPAVAQDEHPIQLQWKQTPGVTMRVLVDKGFDIKAVLEHDIALGSGHNEVTTYVLQKGSEVYRCIESAIVAAEGDMVSQIVYCSVLADPVDANKKSVG